MYDEIEILIPTKGRLDNQKTYLILKTLGLSPKLVVEPQEEASALAKGYNVITLPKDNQGLLFSRNFILDYARQNHIRYLVMIDDDVQYFGYTDFTKKKVIKDNRAFLTALEYFYKSQMSGGMEYVQFAWAGKKFVTFNKGFQVCHFLYMPTIPENLYYDIPLKDDKDFSIALLMSGVQLFNLVGVSLSVPSIGTNSGGLQDEYKNKKDNADAVRLQQKWGTDIIKLVQKKNGRVDANINWRQIKKIMGYEL